MVCQPDFCHIFFSKSPAWIQRIRMTANYGVIFWTTIMLISVFSSCSSLEGDANAVCYKNISITELRYVPYTENYSYNVGRWCFLNCWETRTRTAYKPEYVITWAQQETCCPGYENGTCTANCSSTISNGNCVQPNICTCNHGWGGECCHDPLLCFIVQPNHVYYSEAVSEPPVLKNVQSEDRSIVQKLPACKSRCRDQLSNVPTTNVTRSADGIFYFIPIDSPCNAMQYDRIYGAESLRSSTRYDYVILSVSVIISLLGIAVCIVCIVRRKRRTVITEDNAAMGTEYDDVGIPTILGIREIPKYDSMDMQQSPEYAEVGPQPIFSYVEVGGGPISEYDDVDVQPIHEYANVIPQSNSEYGNVGIHGIPEYLDVVP